MTSLLQMLWFPLLFVIAALSWLGFAISKAMRRDSDHSPSVTVQLPENAHVVANDGTNISN